MQNREQATGMAIENAKEIAALWENSKSAHKRIDRMDKLTEGVHELAKSNTAIATEVKLLAQKFDKVTERIEKDIAKNTEDLEKLKLEPGQKWKLTTEKALTLAVAAIAAFIGGFLAHLFY